MPTVTELLVRLLESVVELPIKIAEVALASPLSFVSVLVGSLFVLASMGLFGYVLVGALAELIGVQIPVPGRGPRAAEGRIPTERPNPNYEKEAAGGAARAKREE